MINAFLRDYDLLFPHVSPEFNGRRGNLHFASEQTSMNFQGYIEGALRSGYRCAQEVTGSRPS